MPTKIDIAAYYAKVFLGDQRSDLGCRVQRIADRDVLRALHDPFGEFVGNVGVDQES